MQAGGSVAAGAGFTDDFRLNIKVTESNAVPTDDQTMAIALTLADTNADLTETVNLGISGSAFDDATAVPSDARAMAIRIWGTGATDNDSSQTTPANANGENDGTFAAVKTNNSLGDLTNPVILSSAAFAGVPANTTPDSSGNGRTGTLSGTTHPALIASPWSGFGNAFSFNGTDLDANTSGINCGTTGTGVSGAFTLEAKIRRDRLGVIENIVGRWGDAASTQNYLLYFLTDDKLYGSVKPSGALVSVVSTATVATGLHDIALTWDGASTLRLFVDGVMQPTASVTALQAPDAVTPLWIGRSNTTGGGAPFPIQGVIDEVRLSNIARYASGYTPLTAPFETDANTLGLWHCDSQSVASKLIRVFFNIPARGLTADTLTLRYNVGAGDVVIFTHSGTAAVDNNAGQFTFDISGLSQTQVAALVLRAQYQAAVVALPETRINVDAYCIELVGVL